LQPRCCFRVSVRYRDTRILLPAVQRRMFNRESFASGKNKGGLASAF